MSAPELLALLLPPGIGPSGFAGFCALSFLTSCLTVVAGIGGGITLLTVLVSFLPPAVALPVHGFVQIGSNAGRAVLFRRHTVWPILGWFGLGAVLGTALAGQVFVTLPKNLLEALIGGFVLYAVWGPKRRGSTGIPLPAFGVVGTVTSFASMFVGGTGPFVASFVSGKNLDKNGLVATHAGCMTLQHGAKAVVFGFIGFHYPPWLALIAAMIGCGLLGTVIGKRLLGGIPERVFRNLFRAVLTVLALRLLVSALFFAG